MRKTIAFLAFTGLTAAAPAPVKLAPIEAYTVVYSVTGPQAGTITQYSRKFGQEQSLVNDLAMAGGARNRAQVITAGDRISSYDPLTRRAGSTANPAYAALARNAAGKSDADLPKALLQGLGFVPTGAVQTIAGETCANWESKTIQQTRCMTADGVVLQARLTIPGGAMVQTATQVRRGDPGPEAVYAVPAGVTVQPVRSLAELPGLGR